MTETKRKVGRPQGSQRTRRYFSADELERFMSAARSAGPRSAALWSVAFYYAMRIGEVVAMKTDDINWDARQLHIVPEKNGVERTYDMPAEVAEALLFWMEHRPDAASPWLWPGRKACHISAIMAWKEFGLLCIKAGLVAVRDGRQVPAFSPHDLRHTQASLMLAAKDPLTSVRDWLRQRSLASVEHYAHDLDRAAHERRMARRAERYLR